jgi:predicted transcriptional regulator
MKKDVMTVRLSPEVHKKLESLANNTKRTKSHLASEAIASYVEHNAWQVARIKESLDEAKVGVPGVPHEDVVEWMGSWNTNHELPPPSAKLP